MVANFLAGGAVINASRAGRRRGGVVDVGVASELDPVARAAAAQGPPRHRRHDRRAGDDPRSRRRPRSRSGIELARDLVAAGNRCLLTGDMGIANTTASAALIAVFTGLAPAEVTGRGTGIDDETLARKVDVIERRPGAAPTRSGRPARRARGGRRPRARRPGRVYARCRGAAHPGRPGRGHRRLRGPGRAGLRGGQRGRHDRRPPLCRTRRDHALAHLGLRPLVDLDLRLGEGSGAALSLALVQARPASCATSRRSTARESPTRTVRDRMADAGCSCWAERGPASRRTPRRYWTRRRGGLPRDGTRIPADAEWAGPDRRAHERRPEHWRTIERGDSPRVLSAAAAALLDSVTAWLARAMDDRRQLDRRGRRGALGSHESSTGCGRLGRHAAARRSR